MFKRYHHSVEALILRNEYLSADKCIIFLIKKGVGK